MLKYASSKLHKPVRSTACAKRANSWVWRLGEVQDSVMLASENLSDCRIRPDPILPCEISAAKPHINAENMCWANTLGRAPLRCIASTGIVFWEDGFFEGACGVTKSIGSNP